MATVQTLDWRAIIVRGLIAGLIGSVLIDAFLYIVLLMPNHASITVIWQALAATVVGKPALTDPSMAWFGLLMHLLISIAWGIAFSYVAQTRENVPEHPYISGIVYGIIVMIIMQIVQMAANIPLQLTVQALLAGLIAHAIFFGLPISLYISRALRT